MNEFCNEQGTLVTHTVPLSPGEFQKVRICTDQLIIVLCLYMCTHANTADTGRRFMHGQLAERHNNYSYK